MAALPDYLEDKAIPPFLAKTFYMLNVSSLRDYVRWADDGKSFIVLKADTLAKEVFPKFFKHNKFSSFVRQLNMYGFSKVNTDGQVMTFYHEMFSRDGVKHLKDIKRRKNVTATAAAAGPDGGEVEDMRDEVISLKRSRDEFEEELTTFRESHERMEEEMENVLQANKRMVADLARVNNEQAVLKARMDTVLEFLGNISASMNFTDVVMRASGDLTVAPPSKRFKASTPPLSATMALEGDAFLDFLLTSGGAVDHMMSDAVPTA